MGGLSSAAFYGAGKAVEALKRGFYRRNSKYTLYRRTQNIGEFSQLEEVMSLRNVKRVARKAGINYDGIKISIDRNPELIKREYFGYTWPSGRKVTLYPRAFENRETLVKTLGHERIHVYQVRLFGPPTTDEMAKMFEAAAYESKEYWWNYYKYLNGGR